MVDFGTDVSTFPDLDRTFTPITGERVVAEAIARRWTTPRGTFRRDPAYGCDVRSLINETITATTLSRWRSLLTEQAEADERVQSASITIVTSTSGNRVAITARITTAAGTFTMVLTIGGVTPISLEVSS